MTERVKNFLKKHIVSIVLFFVAIVVVIGNGFPQTMSVEDIKHYGLEVYLFLASMRQVKEIMLCNFLTTIYYYNTSYSTNININQRQ